MIARRCGIRDICAITGYSKSKVQRTIARSNYIHSPKKQHYSELEIDEFHMHPKFSLFASGRSPHDIGIIVLKTPFKVGSKVTVVDEND